LSIVVAVTRHLTQKKKFAAMTFLSVDKEITPTVVVLLVMMLINSFATKTTCIKRLPLRMTGYVVKRPLTLRGRFVVKENHKICSKEIQNAADLLVTTKLTVFVAIMQLLKNQRVLTTPVAGKKLSTRNYRFAARKKFRTGRRVHTRCVVESVLLIQVLRCAVTI
jgi:hypothetical protein